MTRLRIPVIFLGVIAAALCCSIPAYASKTPPPPTRITAPALAAHLVPALHYIGALEGDAKFSDPVKALSVIQRAHDEGLNTISVRVAWNEEALPHSYDTTDVCNAAHAAEQLGFKAMIIDLTPGQQTWPLIQSDLDLFRDNIGQYDKALFDPGSNCIAHPSPLQVIWELGNEPNVHTFCDGSDKGLNAPTGLLDTHTACAKREALLLHEGYPFIQSEKVKYAASLKPGDLQVIGGGLSSNDAPIDYMNQFFQAVHDLGYKSCYMNYFGFHPYSYQTNRTYGLNLEPTVAATLKAHGCGVPVFYDEMGYATTPSASDVTHACSYYAGGLPESQYLSLVTTAIGDTLSQGVVGYVNMLIDDEPCRNGGWSSGLYYSNGDRKPFEDPVRDLFLNALKPQPAAALPPTRRRVAHD